MQTADRFDLCGQDLLAQKAALLRQRDPKLPDVAERLATYRINRDPYRPLAVRRLLPRIDLRDGNLLLAKKPCLQDFGRSLEPFARVFPAAHFPHRDFGAVSKAPSPAIAAIEFMTPNMRLSEPRRHDGGWKIS
jgi:hypothetical protein